MKTLHAMLAACGLALAGLPAAASAASLTQAWQAALAHDPQYRAAGHERDAAREGVGVARAAALPQVNLQVARTQVTGDREFPNGANQTVRTPVDYEAPQTALQLRTPLFNDEVRARIPDADWARVHFVGRVPYPQFLALLQLSSVHVYLTYPFVLSWSLLEAMSVGCAIVASDTQPLHEAIRHGETGRLVGFFDTAGLVHEIGALLDDPAARQRLGQAARAFACETYDLERVCLPRQLEWVQRLAA